MPGYMEDVPDDEPMVMVKVIWFVRVVDISLNGIKIPEIYIIAEILYILLLHNQGAKLDINAVINKIKTKRIFIWSQFS